MNNASPDRVPYFEEGIRQEVLEAWQAQGHSLKKELAQLPPADPRIELQPDVFPRPLFEDHDWPLDAKGLKRLAKRLDYRDPERYGDDWAEQLEACAQPGATAMLRVHRGFFQAMGVFGWQRFHQLMELLIWQPEFVREYLNLVGDFTARLADRVLSQVKVDAAVFSEPIGSSYDALVSPRMYREVILPGYVPLMQVLEQHGVEHIILRTYANARVLVPEMLNFGFGCLWACEVDLADMDYLELKQEFGSDLRLIGGLDLDALRGSQEGIRTELTGKLPPLLELGGYIPLADGRVREDMPLENYIYYRKLLADLIQSGPIQS
jgi:hypothetical protein